MASYREGLQVGATIPNNTLGPDFIISLKAEASFKKRKFPIFNLT